jgi:hypothetical protein
MKAEEKLRFWLNLVTRWLLAELMFTASAWLLAPRVPRRFMWPLLIVLALSFVFIRFQEMGNERHLTGLLVFALLLGVLVGLWLPNPWRGRFQDSIFIGVGSVFIAVFLGGRFLPVFKSANKILSLFSWAYLAVWVLIWQLPSFKSWGRVWALVGFSLFFLFTAFWSASLQEEGRNPGYAWVELQLFLFSLNLTWPVLFLLSV